MIDIAHLTVRYREHVALDDVSLRVCAGEAVLVAGPSGCGKSTLARVIAGLVPRVTRARVDGHVRVAAVDPATTPPARLAARVGVVLQDPSTQLFGLTVEEEVAFGPRNAGLGEDEVAGRVAWALEATGLARLSERPPFELSGGERQRLAIAAALALRPPLLVLDEPLASLDHGGIAQVTATLRELRRRHGVTLVVIEHRLAEVARLATRVVLLERGRLAADGDAAAVLADRARLEALGLALPPRDGPLTPAPPTGRPLVSLRGVRVARQGRVVLDGADLALHAGECVALVGENGGGKSTLARVLAGLMRPSAGERVLDREALPAGDRDIGLLGEYPLDQLLTERVDDEVALGPLNWGRFDRAAHEATLAAADLVALRARAPASLSVGQQQRTALAATVALATRVVILDEPGLGQDAAHLERVMAAADALLPRGSAVLLITHDHGLARRHAHRVLRLHQGRVTTERTACRCAEVTA